MCGNYTSYLKTVTGDIKKPFLVDLNPIFKDGHLLIYATISSLHMGFKWGEYHTNFTLVYENRMYKNLYSKGSPLPGCNQLFFDIPVTNSFSAGDIITVSLFNLKQKRAYKNVQSCVSVPDPKPLPLAVCSYISNYNTIPELRSWIAFQRVVNVSKVVFFQATPIPGFMEAFGNLIKEGYVEVFDYTWPRPAHHRHIQDNNQQSQVNACFYRLKYRVSAVILCDVDEYVHSEKYPFDLPEVVRYIRKTKPQYDVVTVTLYRNRNA